MFRFFSKKKTPEDDFRDALLSAFKQLQEADKHIGIERSMKTVFALSSLALAIRSTYPNIPIDSDGPAISIARPPQNKEEAAAHANDVEHVLEQVRTCPSDDEMRLTVMAYFLSPSYVNRKMEELSGK